MSQEILKTKATFQWRKRRKHIGGETLNTQSGGCSAPCAKRGYQDKLTLALPDKPSVAVLPFANMSDDKSQEYLADGITENIISTLSQVPNIFVIARNSAFTYKGKPVKVQQVAEDLGVRYVLEEAFKNPVIPCASRPN